MNSNFITSEDKMTTFIDKFCYIVVFPDKKVELFKSLRDIQKSICIDSSTISKKLKENNYFFKAKGSDNIFFTSIKPVLIIVLGAQHRRRSRWSRVIN